MLVQISGTKICTTNFLVQILIHANFGRGTHLIMLRVHEPLDAAGAAEDFRDLVLRGLVAKIALLVGLAIRDLVQVLAPDCRNHLPVPVLEQDDPKTELARVGLVDRHALVQRGHGQAAEIVHRRGEARDDRALFIALHHQSRGPAGGLQVLVHHFFTGLLEERIAHFLRDGVQHR